MATESKKKLALAIIDFLSSSIADGTVPADEKDSVEAAQELIAGAFSVDKDDKKAVQEAIGGQSLLKIYEVFDKMRGKVGGGAGSSSAGAAAGAGAGAAAGAAAPAGSAPSAADKAAAEELKTKGNAAMGKKDYVSAIDNYSQALNLAPNNPIYLSNRAAAYSASNQHELAKNDAQAAVDADPTYSKGWSRLGLAKFALGDAKGSMEAYEKGIQAEGKGGSEAMRKGYETAKRRVQEDDAVPVTPPAEEPISRGASPLGGGGGMPDLASLAGMFGGGGRGGMPGAGVGGGGGMPDFAGLMNNPMFSQMAQNLMSNPDLMGRIMNNPNLRNMMDSAGRGGGMPDMGSLMNDPAIADLAANLMGGGGGGGRGGAGGGAGRGQ